MAMPQGELNPDWNRQGADMRRAGKLRQIKPGTNRHLQTPISKPGLKNNLLRLHA